MRTLAITAIACAAVALPQTIRAANFTVNSTADAVDANPGDGVCRTAKGACTLRAAILEANALAGADDITVPRGVYRLVLRGAGEDAGFTGDLDITDDLVIRGAGETSTIFSGIYSDRVFDVHKPAQVTISYLKVTAGEPPPGTDAGGLLNDGSVTLNHVTFLRNRAGRGDGLAGALKNLGTATLAHVTIAHNRAGDATPKSEGGSIGGMWNDGTAFLTDVTFTGNRAGEAPLGTNWTIRVYGYDINGGGIGAMYNGGDATLTDVVFRANRAGDGSWAGAGGDVGGLWNDGTATLTRVTFDRNRAGNSGVNVTFDGSSGEGGTAGGVANRGTLTMTGALFAGNHAGRGRTGASGGGGGGLYNEGEVHILNATFDRNRAGDTFQGDGGNGGGILDYGIGTLTNVTLTNNHAGNAGGKLYYGYHTQAGFGGGYWGSGTLTNVTVALNRAGRAVQGGYNGAGDQLAGGPQLVNTIVYGRGPSCSAYGTYYYGAGVTSLGHNLDSGSSCGFAQAGDLNNTDPQLDRIRSTLTLRDNGGFTRTVALLSISPAIDAADDAACPATDQRGVARPWGAGCDIGAYEYQSVYQSPPPTRTATATPPPTQTPTTTVTPTITLTPTITVTPTVTLTHTPTITPGGPTLTPTETPTTTPTSSLLLDTFSASHDYSTGDVSGTIWTAALNAGNPSLFNANTTNAGQLSMYSSNTSWENAADNGPFLYVDLLPGDFLAETKITAANTVLHNDMGIMARVANLSDAGPGEDYVAARYFAAGSLNALRSTDNGASANANFGGSLQPYLRLQRTGNVFSVTVSSDGMTWSSPLTVTRSDMAGLPLQVGLWQAVFSSNTGQAQFDYFQVSGALP